MNFLRRVLKRDEVFVLLVSFFVCSLNLLPTVIGYFKSSPAKQFSGIGQYFNSADVNVYINAINQGREGSWLWENRFASEPSGRYPVYTFYIFLGHISKLLNLSPYFVYYFSAFVLGFLVLFTAWLLLKRFIDQAVIRRMTFLLFAFACGWGWVDPRGGYTYYTDTTLFTSLTTPHWLLEFALFWATLYLILMSWRSFSWGKSLLIMVLGLTVGLTRPYSLLVLLVVSSLYGFVQFVLKKERESSLRYFFRLSPFFLASLPLLIFLEIYYSGDAFLSVWKSQIYLPTPNPLFLIIGFGPLSVLVLLGLYTKIRSPVISDSALFILVWLFGQTVLLYIPVSFQLLLIKGLIFPLMIAAGWGLEVLLIRLKKVSLAHILFLLSCVASLGYLYLNFAGLFYLENDISAGFDWLNKNANKGETVFSNYYIGNFLPAKTGLRAFAGYHHLVPNWKEKFGILAQFRGCDISGLAKVLKKHNVRYIFSECALRPSLNEEEIRLKEVFSRGDVRICKVSFGRNL